MQNPAITALLRGSGGSRTPGCVSALGYIFLSIVGVFKGGRKWWSPYEFMRPRRCARHSGLRPLYLFFATPLVHETCFFSPRRRRRRRGQVNGPTVTRCWICDSSWKLSSSKRLQRRVTPVPRVRSRSSPGRWIWPKVVQLSRLGRAFAKAP